VTQTNYPDPTSQAFAWVLDELCKDVRGALHAAVLTVDGLRKSASTGLGLDVDSHDLLASTGASLIGTSSALPRIFDLGEFEVLMMRAGRGWVVAMSFGARACLVVVADATGDPGMIVNCMQQVVENTAHQFAADPRAPQAVL
jgi:predicted regulator of Ras-like GTPase activity (Roadblock/LC7/MglB family)